MGSQFKVRWSEIDKSLVSRLIGRLVSKGPIWRVSSRGRRNPRRRCRRSLHRSSQLPQDPRTSRRSAKSTDPLSVRSSRQAGGAHELEAQSAASEVPPTAEHVSGTRTTQSPVVRQHARGAHTLSAQENPRPLKIPPPFSQPAGVSSEHSEPKQQAPIEAGGHGDGALRFCTKRPTTESHSSLNGDTGHWQAASSRAGIPNSPPGPRCHHGRSRSQSTTMSP